MLVAVAVIVVLAIGLAAAWLLRRRGGDEVHSIEGYHQTLNTLQGLRAKSPGSTVRILDSTKGDTHGIGKVEPISAPIPPGEAVAQDQVSGPSVEPESAAPSIESPEPPATTPSLVFGTEELSDEKSNPRFLRLDQRTKDRAMTAMNHRPRRLGAPIASAVVVLVVVLILALLGAHQHDKPPALSQHRSGTTSQTTTTGHHRGGHRSTATTTTTRPTQFAAVASTSSTATYQPPASAYVVAVDATSGPCYIELRSLATGVTSYAQVLATGQSKSFTLIGATTVLLGAPTQATVSLDHEPVVLPTGYVTPFRMNFEPLGSTTSTTSTTTTTTTTTSTTTTTVPPVQSNP